MGSGKAEGLAVPSISDPSPATRVRLLGRRVDGSACLQAYLRRLRRCSAWLRGQRGARVTARSGRRGQPGAISPLPSTLAGECVIMGNGRAASMQNAATDYCEAQGVGQRARPTPAGGRRAASRHRGIAA